MNEWRMANSMRGSSTAGKTPVRGMQIEAEVHVG
jgi:hypothetical protein